MGSAREGTDALQNLGGVLLLVEIDGEEHVVLLKVEGRGLAGPKEVRDVLHLDERHSGLLELDSGWSDGQVHEPIMIGVTKHSNDLTCKI